MITAEEIVGCQATPGIKRLWNSFLAISAIPRPSGSEQAVTKYLARFARKRKLAFQTDKAGNVLILVPAAIGFEAQPGIVLQAHLDMVCVGEPDPAKKGVVPVVDRNGQWLKAQGTSLGADNGIGLAVLLALADESLKAGPLALLFTVDEEGGLKGANRLSFKELKKYRYWLNLDSEEEGEIVIGCAGGGDTVISLPLEKQPLKDKTLFLLRVDNLLGGHSGIDIDKKRLNAIRELARVIRFLRENLNEVVLVSFQGGSRRNVIPKKAEAVIATSASRTQIQTLVSEAQQALRLRARNRTEKAAVISLLPVKEKMRRGLTDQSSRAAIDLLLSLPHGVIKMSRAVKGLVETSTNLATVKTNGKEMKIEMMTRSSIETELEKVRTEIASRARSFRAKVSQENPYPGWEPQPKNHLVALVKKEYRRFTDQPVRIKAIHAGLECGLILKKHPHFQAVSIGPTIKGAHSTEEKVNIASVGRFYQLIKAIIQAIAVSG